MPRFKSIIDHPYIDIIVVEEKIVNILADMGEQGTRILAIIDKGIKNPAKPDDVIIIYLMFSTKYEQVNLIVGNNKPLPFKIPNIDRELGHILLMGGYSPLAMITFLEDLEIKDPDSKRYYVDMRNYFRRVCYKHEIELT